MKKQKTLTVISILFLLISIFTFLNNTNNVKATYGTEQTVNYINGFSPDNSVVNLNRLTIYVFDNDVFFYNDTNGNLEHSIINLTDVNIPYNYKFRSAIIELNNTSIILAQTYTRKSDAHPHCKAYIINTEDYSNSTLFNDELINGAYTTYSSGAERQEAIKLKECNGNYYVLMSYKGNPQTYIYGAKIYPTTDTFTVTGETLGTNALISTDAIGIQDVNNNFVYYFLSQISVSYQQLVKIDFQLKTYDIISTIGLSTVITDLEEGYLYEINHAYGLYNSGNYSLMYATSLKNATFNGICLRTYIFDGLGFDAYTDEQFGLMDFTSARVPIRIIASTNNYYIGQYKIVAIDGENNYRYVTINVGNNGFGYSNAINSFSIVPIYQTIREDEYEGWTYLSYPDFYFTSSTNIGGYQHKNSNLMLMVDYENKKINVQTGDILIDGSSYYLNISKSPYTYDNFNVYNSTYDNCFIISADYNLDWLGESPHYQILGRMYSGNERITTDNGYYVAFLSDVSEIPYTLDDVLDVVSGSIYASDDSLADGNFFIDFSASEYSEDYYYQLMVISGTYELTVDTELVFFSGTAVCFMVFHDSSVTDLPSIELPSEYTIDYSGTTPTPTPIPSEYDIGDVEFNSNFYLVFIVYIIICITLSLIAGRDGLVIGLVLSTILCLIGGLIPIWGLVVIILALIFLILDKSGSLSRFIGDD